MLNITKRYFCIFIFYFIMSVNCSSQNKKTLEFVIKPDSSAAGGGDLICSGPQSFDVEVNEPYGIRVNYTSINLIARYGHGHMDKIRMFKGSGDYYLCDEPRRETKKGNLYYVAHFFTKICSQIKNNICYYGQNYEDKGVSCETKIISHEPGETISRPNGTFEINSIIISDNEKKYYFYDGQSTNFTCKKDVGKFVMLMYVTIAGGSETTNHQQSDSVSMYMKLTAGMNGTRITCIISAEGGQEQRTTVTLTYRQQELTTFTVNGLIPSFKKLDSSHYYEYIYHDDEELIVNFINDMKMQHSSSCNSTSPNAPYLLHQFFKNGEKSMDDEAVTFPISQGGSGTSITCAVDYRSYKITFRYHDAYYKSLFSDLTVSNILRQFKNNTKNYIEYEADLDAKVALDCLCDSSKTYYVVTDHYSDIASGVRQYYKEMSVEKQLILESNDPSGTLECLSTLVRVSRKRNNVNHWTTQGYVYESPLTTHKPVYTERGTTESPKQANPSGQNPGTNIYQNNDTPPSQDQENHKQNDDLPGSQNTSNDQNVNSASENNYSNGNPTSFQNPLRDSINDPMATTKDFLNNEKQYNAGLHPNDVNGLPNSREMRKKSYKDRKTDAIPSTRIPSKPKTKKNSGNPLPVSPNPQTGQKYSNGPVTKLHENPPKNPETSANKQNFENIGQLTPSQGNSTAGSDASQVTSTGSGVADRSGHMVIAFSVVLVILLLAAVLWLAHSIRKKRRLLKHNANMEYQTLPEHHEGPMSTPSQWDNRPDDVTYSHPVVDNVYTTPVPKANRKPNQEPVYALPRDSTQNYAYATGNMEQNSEAGYTSIGSDSNYAVIGQNEPNYATVGNNDPTYASVQKAIANAMCNRLGTNPPQTQEYQNLQPKPPDTYAQVQKKSLRNAGKKAKEPSPYQNTDKYGVTIPNSQLPNNKVLPRMTYANVQDLISAERAYVNNSECGYVNGDVKDEVEPAYSELAKK